MAKHAAAPARPNAARRFYNWATAKHNSSLVVLVSLSIGLAMVAVQIDQDWLLGLFSLIWAVTFFGLVAQFWGRHEAAAQHRLA